MSNSVMRSSNFWLAIGLIVIGTFFLLDNFDIVEIGNFWHLWPLILIAIGFSKFSGSNYQDRNSAFVLIGIGGFFLLMNYDILDWDEVWQFWPVVLIVIGISIIFRRSRNDPNTEERASSSDDRIDVVAIFSGNSRKIKSDKFEGGNVSAICGGAKIDLTGSKLSSSENILDVFSLFGGAEIKVPDDWHITMKGLPIFGGFEDSRKNSPAGDGLQNNTLIIKGLMMFGGLTIKAAKS